MDQRTLYVKTLHYQKTGVDVLFNLVTAVQQGGQSIMKQSIENASWLPKNSKESCISLFDQFSKNTQALRDAVDQGYDGIDRFFTTDKSASQKSAASPPAQKTEKATTQKDNEPAATESVKPKRPRTKTATTAKRTNQTKTASTKKTTVKAKPAKKTAVTTKDKDTTKPSLNTEKAEVTQKDNTVSALKDTADKQVGRRPSALQTETVEQQKAASNKDQAVDQEQVKTKPATPDTMDV